MSDGDMQNRPSGHVFGAKAPLLSDNWGNRSPSATASVPNRQRIHCHSGNTAQIHDTYLGNLFLQSCKRRYHRRS